jgi:hypothetical protein
MKGNRRLWIGVFLREGTCILDFLKYNEGEINFREVISGLASWFQLCSSFSFAKLIENFPEVWSSCWIANPAQS